MKNGDNQFLSAVIPESEVKIDTESSKPSLVDLKNNIKNTLREVDKARREGHPDEVGGSLEQVWDQVNAFTDMNELVRLNIQQTQIHIQEEEKNYWETKRKNESRLKELLDQGPEYYPQYQKEAKRFNLQDMDAQNNLSSLRNIQLKLAKEYRQCALQKKWVIHVALVEQFKLAVLSAIHSNITDKQTLEQIADDIENAGKKLFPRNARSLEDF